MTWTGAGRADRVVDADVVGKGPRCETRKTRLVKAETGEEGAHWKKVGAGEREKGGRGGPKTSAAEMDWTRPGVVGRDGLR